jgi:hypothetical protein
MATGRSWSAGPAPDTAEEVEPTATGTITRTGSLDPAVRPASLRGRGGRPKSPAQMWT